MQAARRRFPAGELAGARRTRAPRRWLPSECYRYHQIEQLKEEIEEAMKTFESAATEIGMGSAFKQLDEAELTELGQLGQKTSTEPQRPLGKSVCTSR